MVRRKTMIGRIGLVIAILAVAGCRREPTVNPAVSQRVWQLSSNDPVVVQAAVDFLLSQDEKLAVPALMERITDLNVLVVQRVVIQDVRKPAKPVRIYHPKKACDLVALILSEKTGQKFEAIYDGGTDAQRLSAIGSWQNWWNNNKNRY